MRKKARLTPPEELCDSEDYIDLLPDHLIVTILSYLSLKDAATTSNLSRRWLYLWTQVTALDFNASDALDRIAVNPRLRSSERPKYINWVNRVVRQYRGSRVNVFRICFDLDKSSKCAIDNWIRHSFAMRVQKLELDLLENGESLRQPLRNYAFPHKLLTQCKGSSPKHIHSSFPGMQPYSLNGWKYLKSLYLKCVNVSDEAMEYIWSNCPVLQLLSMHGSGDLTKVRVCGLRLALKSLEMVFCLGIESVEISNVNLVSFRYLGPGINLLINNVPKLAEISMGEGYSGLENNVFAQLSCCLYQLKVLTLDIYRPEENMKSFAFPQLPNLKQLILKIGAWDDDCLLEFASLIKACPYLRSIVFQLIWMSPAKKRRKIRQADECPLRHLKLVEIAGYYGRTSDAELAMFFIDNAVCLQKIVIDPGNQTVNRTPVKAAQLKKVEGARNHAKQHLEEKMPRGAKLVIL